MLPIHPISAPTRVSGFEPAAPDPIFRLLAEQSGEILTVLEPDGRIAYDSPAVERVLGYPQGALVGSSAFLLVHPDDLAAARTLLVRSVAEPERLASMTVRLRHCDGRWRMLETSGRCTRVDGELRVLVASREVGGPAVAAAQPEGAGDPDMLAAVELEMMDRLARAAEFRDDDTGQHTRRVGELAGELAQHMGRPEADPELVRRAAPLHDVGKIGIRDAILLKPGPLAAEEMEIMRTHTVLGARLLARGRSRFVRAAETVALHHHERWDGAGYPGGLRAREIPMLARIVGVADAYDALTHDRAYRAAWPARAALEWIQGEGGRAFDPEVAAALGEVLSGPGVAQPQSQRDST